jgi:beta-N-acetylhexosaminidase
MNLSRPPQSWAIFGLLVGATCSVDSGSLYQNAGSEFGPVRPGVEVLLEDSLHLVADKRVGLLTNQTGVDASGRSSIDRLFEHDDIDLVALFSPEHGIRGTAEAGETVEDGRDPGTGLPIHSLYGSVRKPTPEMLEGIDVLLVDYQDIGARYWTYASTMTLAMEAAGEADIPVVVLDRPNPIGGATQGNILLPRFGTFVGRFPIPMRHGMTPGELARYSSGEFGIEVDLHVAPAEGWSREMTFAETGLPWIQPSPNMPDIDSATHYPGTCLFEGTRLSVARGTDHPFQQVGAPWLDGEALARTMNRYGLPGVRFEAVRFTPVSPGDGKFDGVEVEGVRLIATSTEYDPTHAALALLVETHRMSAENWGWLQSHFDRLAGTDLLRKGITDGASVDELRAGWDEALEEFKRSREPYLIYP